MHQLFEHDSLAMGDFTRFFLKKTLSLMTIAESVDTIDLIILVYIKSMVGTMIASEVYGRYYSSICTNQ